METNHCDNNECVELIKSIQENSLISEIISKYEKVENFNVTFKGDYPLSATIKKKYKEIFEKLISEKGDDVVNPESDLTINCTKMDNIWMPIYWALKESDDYYCDKLIKLNKTFIDKSSNNVLYHFFNVIQNTSELKKTSNFYSEDVEIQFATKLDKILKNNKDIHIDITLEKEKKTPVYCLVEYRLSHILIVLLRHIYNTKKNIIDYEKVINCINENDEINNEFHTYVEYIEKYEQYINKREDEYKLFGIEPIYGCIYDKNNEKFSELLDKYNVRTPNKINEVYAEITSKSLEKSLINVAIDMNDYSAIKCIYNCSPPIQQQHKILWEYIKLTKPIEYTIRSILFGIEIECCTAITSENTKIVESDKFPKLYEKKKNNSPMYFYDTIEKGVKMSKWLYTSDGSIRCDQNLSSVEFVSPSYFMGNNTNEYKQFTYQSKLEPNEVYKSLKIIDSSNNYYEGLNLLTIQHDFLFNNTIKNNYTRTINESCGLHVHLSNSVADKLNTKQIEQILLNFAKIWWYIEPIIYLIVEEHRRCNIYCAFFRESGKTLLDIPQFMIDPQKYWALNLVYAVGSTKISTHIEIRIHHATTDIVEIKNWVLFLTKLYGYCISDTFNTEQRIFEKLKERNSNIPESIKNVGDLHEFKDKCTLLFEYLFDIIIKDEYLKQYYGVKLGYNKEINQENLYTYYVDQVKTDISNNITGGALPKKELTYEKEQTANIPEKEHENIKKNIIKVLTTIKNEIEKIEYPNPSKDPNQSKNSNMPDIIHYKDKSFFYITPFGEYIITEKHLENTKYIRDAKIIEFYNLVSLCLENEKLFDYNDVVCIFLAKYRYIYRDYFYIEFENLKEKFSKYFDNCSINKFKKKYQKYKKKYITLKQFIIKAF